MLFYRAKSISDHFKISKFFKNFFFHFRPLYCKGEKLEVRKKIIILCSFLVQSSIQTILRFQNFSKFFFYKKSIFFTVSNPYTAKVRNMQSEKNYFLVLLYSARSNSDQFTISKPFHMFYFVKSNFFTVSTSILQKRET